MQQQITRWLEQFGLEFGGVMSLLMVLGLIVLISVAIHLVLHRVVLAALQRRGQQSQRVWQQAITQYKLFQRGAAASSASRRRCGCRAAAKPRR